MEVPGQSIKMISDPIIISFCGLVITKVISSSTQWSLWDQQKAVARHYEMVTS